MQATGNLQAELSHYRRSLQQRIREVRVHGQRDTDDLEALLEATELLLARIEAA